MTTQNPPTMTKVNTPLIHQLRQRESLEGRREVRPPDWRGRREGGTMHGSATRTFAPDLISDIHHHKVKGHQELLKGTSTAKAMIYWNASSRRTITHAANKTDACQAASTAPFYYLAFFRPSSLPPTVLPSAPLLLLASPAPSAASSRPLMTSYRQ